MLFELVPSKLFASIALTKLPNYIEVISLCVSVLVIHTFPSFPPDNKKLGAINFIELIKPSL